MAHKIKGELDIEIGLGLPSVTTTFRTSYTPPRAGYQVYDTDLTAVFTWNGSAWIQGATGDAAYTKAESDGTAGTAGAKTDKVSGATAGNFAGLDASGNLIDSGSTTADFATAAQGTTADGAVQRTGDTMTGLLVLSADPTVDLGAATKQYVDAQIDSVNTVAELTDTTVTTPADGEALFYDNGFWVNRSIVAADISDGATAFATGAEGDLAVSALQDLTSESIGTLSDVVITDAAAGEFLRFDGSNWVDTVLVAADIPDISDTYVDLTSSQTIGGLKTFSGPIVVGDQVNISATSGTSTDIRFRDDANALTGIFAAGATSVDLTKIAPGTNTELSLRDDFILATKVIRGETPSDPADLTTKAYVDDQINSVNTFAELTDTTITTPADGEALFYDNGFWVNRNVTAADVVDGDAVFGTAAQGDLADTAVQPGDATSTLTNNDAFVDLTTNQTVAGEKTFSDNAAFSQNVTVTGDLTVNGTTTTVNSTNLEITDSIITVNQGELGAGVTSPNQAGIMVDRGTENNFFMIWDESSDSFGVAEDTGGQDGVVDLTTFQAFALAADVAATKYQTTFDTADWGQPPGAGQNETNYDGSGSNGSFVGGDGAGGTAYVAADTITLTDGTVITVDTINANGDVTEFTVTTAGNSAAVAGVAIAQDTTSGTGTGFTLTPGTANLTGPKKYTVTAATHGIAYSANEVFIVQTYEADGSQVTIDTTVDQATGDVTLSTVGAAFTGRIIMTK